MILDIGQCLYVEHRELRLDLCLGGPEGNKGGWALRTLVLPQRLQLENVITLSRLVGRRGPHGIRVLFCAFEILHINSSEYCSQGMKTQQAC